MKSKIPSDRGKAAFLIFAAICCLTRLVLILIVGKQGVAYAGPALEMSAIFVLAVPVASSLILTKLIKTRYRRERYASIHDLVSFADLTTFFLGLVTSLLMLVLSRPISLIFGGEEHMYLIFAVTSPVFIFLSTTGVVRGYFRGISMAPPANTILIVQGVLTGILSPVLGYIFRTKGNSVAALLRNSSYPFVYGAAGVMAGAVLASLITCLYSLLLRFLTSASLKKRMPVSLQTDKESKAYLHKALLSGAATLMLLGVLLELPVLTDYRILHAAVDNKTTAMVGWGSYYAKTLSLVYGSAFLLILPFSGYIKTLGRYYRDDDIATFRSFFGMMMRLAGYVLLPFSMFYIAAARLITGIIGNTYDASAAVSLEINGILVFFIGIDTLLIFIYIETNRVRKLVIAAAISYVFQTITAVILSGQSGPGITVASVPLTVFFAVLFGMLLIFMRRELVTRNTYAKAYFLMIVCAVGAAILIFIISGILESETGYIAATVLSAFIYIAVYVMATLITSAADLRNIERLPGGSFIINIADLFNL